MRVDVTGSLKDVERSLGELRGAMPIAATRAINLAITKAQSVATKTIAAEIGLKQKTVRELLRLRKATRAELFARLEPASGRRIPIIEMNARQTKKGVNYTSRGKRKTLTGAFVAVMSNYHTGVFGRVTKKRLPIVELLGPSVPKLLVQKHILAAIDESARAVYGKELDRQVALLLKRGPA